MSFFSRPLAVLTGAQSFPQPSLRAAKNALLLTCAITPQFLTAQTGGRIAGAVNDSTGAVIPNSPVLLINPANGVRQNVTTGNDGIFTFAAVPVGQYEIEVKADGFNPYRQTENLKIDVNTALTIDLVLQAADASQTVNVTKNTAEVHTTDTQIGQTIESEQVVDIPLNGRSYTDLLAVQAGVSPVTTSGAGNTSSGGGFGTVPAAGQTNTGQFSINGQRESDNAYYLNGASVQETIGQQTGIIPNLDSIAEFRILSSNVDAEYGSFTGIINVVTKAGTNAFQGNLFEFFRNTHLDATTAPVTNLTTTLGTANHTSIRQPSHRMRSVRRATPSAGCFTALASTTTTWPCIK